jgi:hypothetical protein
MPNKATVFPLKYVPGLIFFNPSLEGAYFRRGGGEAFQNNFKKF